MQRITITSTRYHTPYRTISVILVWVVAICNGLSRITIKFIKKFYIHIFLRNRR